MELINLPANCCFASIISCFTHCDVFILKQLQLFLHTSCDVELFRTVIVVVLINNIEYCRYAINKPFLEKCTVLVNR